MTYFYNKYNHLITFNKLKLIDAAKPLSLQEFELDEDLLQLKCGKIIIDVGWYPSLDINGEFRVMVVENEDWESYMESINTSNMIELESILEKLVSTYCYGCPTVVVLPGL